MSKVTKKIKIIWLLAFLWTTQLSSISAQESYDLNGIFEGEHIEYSVDGSNDSMVYYYKFELEQNEDRIQGRSYIYNDDGYYAVVQLRGLLVKDELYFEEFETLDEINPEFNHWCYTSGHLSVIPEADRIRLKGFTKSYTKRYGAFCRVGFSDLSKIIDPMPEQEKWSADEYDPISNIIVHPNPTRSESSINFQLLQDEWTIIEVRDLEGELILDVVDRQLSPGQYNFPIDLSFKQDGMYIVELIVNQRLYSAELWKGRF